jgi:hypothetical protein
MKLVLFQKPGASDVLPGILTDRGVVSIADAVPASYTPQLTMEGIIDHFDALRPALERRADEGDRLPLSDIRLRAPLKRSWEKGIYIGADSTNPEAIERNRPKAAS